MIKLAALLVVVQKFVQLIAVSLLLKGPILDKKWQKRPL